MKLRNDIDAQPFLDLMAAVTIFDMKVGVGEDDAGWRSSTALTKLFSMTQADSLHILSTLAKEQAIKFKEKRYMSTEYVAWRVEPADLV